MSSVVKRYIDEINQLPEDDRVAILDGVWASLGDDAKDELYTTDQTIDPEFRAEIERRSDEAHAHPERLIDGAEAMRMVREHLAANPSTPNPDRPEASERAKQLLEAVRALPAEELDDFLDGVWNEYMGGPPDPYPDEEAWRTELDRRIASIDDGTAVLIPFDEAMADAKARLARNRTNPE